MYGIGEAITFHAQFFDLLGFGLPGITVTCNVYAPDGTLTVSAGSTTDRGWGVFRYIFSGADDQVGEWLGIFSTTDANADIKDIADRQQVVAVGFDALSAHIDALIASLTAIDGKIDALDDNIDALTASLTATDGKIDTIDDIVDTLLALLTSGNGGTLDSDVKKDLLISSLEVALQDARTSAGVDSLAEVEANLAAIRVAFDDDPENVSAQDLYTIFLQLEALDMPSTINLNRVFLRLRSSVEDILPRGFMMPVSGTLYPEGGKPL